MDKWVERFDEKFEDVGTHEIGSIVGCSFYNEAENIKKFIQQLLDEQREGFVKKLHGCFSEDGMVQTIENVKELITELEEKK